MKLSPTLEIELTLKELKIPFVKEYKFCKTRRWRFDYAILDKKIAVELEGAIWVGGRHTRGSGFIKDCIKYNTATVMGWRVLRYTSVNLGELKKDLWSLFK